jgi:hypothetical protein
MEGLQPIKMGPSKEAADDTNLSPNLLARSMQPSTFVSSTMSASVCSFA